MFLEIARAVDIDSSVCNVCFDSSVYNDLSSDVSLDFASSVCFDFDGSVCLNLSEDFFDLDKEILER